MRPSSSQRETKAVLFDLDDTLFDHRETLRAALDDLRRHHATLARIEPDDLEREYGRLLEELHPEVLRGRLSLEEARRERFRRLFAIRGEEPAPDTLASIAAEFRRVYQMNRRAVPGAAALLGHLRPIVKIAIVSNNLLEEQRGKMRACGLETLVDALVVSEEIGAAKPDPAIFRAALERVGAPAEAAVMIGDAWETDVLGAARAGIRAVWLNRFRDACPDAARATEIRALEPVEEVARIILRSNRDDRGRAQPTADTRSGVSARGAERPGVVE